MEKRWWYVYMIATDKSAFYTGITTDIERRFQQHLDVASGVPNSRGAKFFRLHTPVAVIYQQRFASRSEASKHEYAIKQLSKQQKRALSSTPAAQ